MLLRALGQHPACKPSIASLSEPTHAISLGQRAPPQQLDNPFANSEAKFHTAVLPPVTFRQPASHPCGNSFSFSRKIPRTGAQSVHFVRHGSTREWKFVHPLVQISTRVYSARSLCSVVDSKPSAVVSVRTGNVRPAWRHADEQGRARARVGIAAEHQRIQIESMMRAHQFTPQEVSVCLAVQTIEAWLLAQHDPNPEMHANAKNVLKEREGRLDGAVISRLANDLDIQLARKRSPSLNRFVSILEGLAATRQAHAA